MTGRGMDSCGPASRRSSKCSILNETMRSNTMILAGLDVGALWTKAVILKDGAVAVYSVARTGDMAEEAGEQCLNGVLASAGISRSDVAAVAVTGVGKKLIPFADKQVSEIVSAAKGIQYLYPDMEGVIDLGGESTRVVKFEAGGGIVDYAQNDKCAAGTGMFLDAMSKVMGIKVEDMGALSLQSTAEVNITSMCVAFAESEVVSRVHRQTPKKDIVRGIHKSIASRVYGMVNSVGLSEKNMVIGGPPL